jgi:hypothetical protein
MITGGSAMSNLVAIIASNNKKKFDASRLSASRNSWAAARKVLTEAEKKERSKKHQKTLKAKKKK